MTGLLAVALSAMTASACLVQVRVSCPDTDKSAVGVEVCIAGVGCALTDDQGIASILVPKFDTYTICVTPSTLPPGAKLAPLCTKIKVTDDAPPVVNMYLSGNFCSTPPPPGPCWLTGGGTIGRNGGQPNYSFGGVVYPGCTESCGRRQLECH
jgi:hypothetical protein